MTLRATGQALGTGRFGWRKNLKRMSKLGFHRQRHSLKAWSRRNRDPSLTL